jgi:putative endonuclease
VRLKQHNQGLVRSTKYRIPLKLVYYEEYNTRKETLMREKEIKRMKGGNSFKLLQRLF